MFSQQQHHGRQQPIRIEIEFVLLDVAEEYLPIDAIGAVMGDLQELGPQLVDLLNDARQQTMGNQHRRRIGSAQDVFEFLKLHRTDLLPMLIGLQSFDCFANYQ
jgi:hypothetical protein